VRASVRLSDATVPRFNSPAEPACIFYGRTGSAIENAQAGSAGKKSHRPAGSPLRLFFFVVCHHRLRFNAPAESASAVR